MLLLLAMVGVCWSMAFLVPMTVLSPVCGIFGALAWAKLMEQAEALPYRATWLLGSIFHLAVFYWMPEGVVNYYSFFQLSFADGVMAWIVVSGFNGLQFVLAHFVAARLSVRRICGRSLATALGWLAAELIFYRPFPWYLGATQLRVPQMAAPAELFGVPFVSFIVVLLAALVCRAWNEPRALGKSSLVVVALMVWAAVRSDAIHTDLRSAGRVAVGMVQGNDPILPEPTFAQIAENISTYLRLSDQLSPTPDFIVWPEGAVMKTMSATETHISPNFGTGLPQPRRTLLFAGKLGAVLPDSGQEGFQISANLLKPDGEFHPAYQKRHTLPLAEDIPLRTTFPWLTHIFGHRYFVPGSRGDPIVMPFPRGSAREVLRPDFKIATLICYEDMLPELFREMTKASDANLLVALTNEQWFGTTVASSQHAMLAAWRAVENRRFLLRVTTTGRSIAVNPWGEIVASLPPFQEAAMTVTDVPLLEGRTIFALLGLWPLQVVSVIVFLLSITPFATIQSVRSRLA